MSKSSEWHSAAPTHWRRSPLGGHFTERKTQVNDRDFPPLSVTKSGVVPQLDTVAKTNNNDARKLVRVGDFVINSRSDRKGSAGLSSRDGSVSVINTVLEPRQSIDPKFAHHLLRSGAFQEEFYRWGSGIVADLWSTRYSSMKAITVALPSKEEQRAIADYLDRETAQIDALIAKQEQLIATLRERRIATIADAFARWPVAPLRRIASVTDCAHFTAELTDSSEYPVVSIAECKSEVVDLSGARGTTADHFETLRAGGRAPTAGDLVFIRNVSVGLVAEVDASLPPFALGQETVLIRPSGQTSPRLLRYGLSGARVQSAIDEVMVGSTFRRINVGAIRNLPVPMVPFEDQHRIVAELDAQTAQIDELIGKAERCIALAKERRAALITAAVTGQIAVPGFDPAADQTDETTKVA